MNLHTVLGAAGALFVPAAFAAAIGVSPILVQMGQGERVAALTVTNGSDEAVVVQVEPLRWQQVDGQDVYDGDGTIVVTPPMFRVPANGQQVVRVGFPERPHAPTETAYRVYFREVPEADAGEPGEVQWVLRLGVPLFVAPATPVQRDVVWEALATEDGLRLAIGNRGNTHLRLTQIRIVDANDRLLAESQSLVYVLPGVTRTLDLAADETLRPGMPVKVIAQSGQGALHAQFVLARE